MNFQASHQASTFRDAEMILLIEGGGGGDSRQEEEEEVMVSSQLTNGYRWMIRWLQAAAKDPKYKEDNKNIWNREEQEQEEKEEEQEE